MNLSNIISKPLHLSTVFVWLHCLFIRMAVLAQPFHPGWPMVPMQQRPLPPPFAPVINPGAFPGGGFYPPQAQPQQPFAPNGYPPQQQTPQCPSCNCEQFCNANQQNPQQQPPQSSSMNLNNEQINNSQQQQQSVINPACAGQHLPGLECPELITPANQYYVHYRCSSDIVAEINFLPEQCGAVRVKQVVKGQELLGQGVERIEIESIGAQCVPQLLQSSNGQSYCMLVKAFQFRNRRLLVNANLILTQGQCDVATPCPNEKI